MSGDAMTDPTHLSDDDILNRAYAAYLTGGAEAANKSAEADGATTGAWCTKCNEAVFNVKNLCVVCWTKLDEDNDA